MNLKSPTTALLPSLMIAGSMAAQPTEEVLAATAKPKKLEEIVVTGNPLKTDDVVAPVSSLSGADLVLKRGATLGDTLDGIAGVSNASFGPNAGRPVIRGLDGDRIRVLSNSGATFDASSVSFDHNTAIDPLAIERVEVLRGPAALLYGGGAIGGVVNVIDNRIPKEAISGAGGAIEMRVGGPERERGSAGLLEAGNGSLALHADGFDRTTGNYRVPRGAGLGDRIVNSGSSSKGGALGASWTFAGGHMGLSRAEYRSNYGTVAEPDVKIDMKQSRTTLEGEMTGLGQTLESLSARIGQTDYRHTELEGSEVGTRFTNKGHDFRLEARHAPLGPASGLVGVQAESFTFAALGEEAFVPSTRSRNQAIFLYEEVQPGPWKISMGARAEINRVTSAGEAASGIARFGSAAEKVFRLFSASTGVLLKLDADASLTASLSHSQRGPAFYELFADGPHVATAAYELGDRSLQREKSNALDAGVQWKWGPSGKSNARVGVFMNRFDNYIALRRSGILRDAQGRTGVIDCGDGTSRESGCAARILPEFRYQGVKAGLSGFELEARLRLVEKPHTLDWEVKADYTRAQDRTNNEPLPRIAPMRLNQALIYSSGHWSLRTDVDYSARQGRVPGNDLAGATPAHTLVHAALSYTAQLPGATLLAFLKLNNIGDRLAYNASSIDTVRLLAPLPGRGIKAGVQLNF